jgi:hypothetical protein
VNKSLHVRAMLQAGRSRDRFPITSLNFLRLGYTQPLTEISTINKQNLRSKERPVRKADNLAAICEPIV